MSNFGVKRHLLSLELHVQFHLLQRSGTFSLSIETRRQITCSPLNWRKKNTHNFVRYVIHVLRSDRELEC